MGKEVITHTDSVSVPGWSGAGYIVLDPDTGVGAYKISGGSNGGKYGENETAENIFNVMVAIIAEVGNDLQKIIGKFLGYLGNAFDIMAIWEACDSGEEKFGALFLYVEYSAVFSVLISAMANPLTGLALPWLIGFVVLFTIIMSFVVKKLIADCKRW